MYQKHNFLFVKINVKKWSVSSSHFPENILFPLKQANTQLCTIESDLEEYIFYPFSFQKLKLGWGPLEEMWTRENIITTNGKAKNADGNKNSYHSK